MKRILNILADCVIGLTGVISDKEHLRKNMETLIGDLTTIKDETALNPLFRVYCGVRKRMIELGENTYEYDKRLLVYFETRLRINKLDND